MHAILVKAFKSGSDKESQPSACACMHTLMRHNTIGLGFGKICIRNRNANYFEGVIPAGYCLNGVFKTLLTFLLIMGPSPCTSFVQLSTLTRAFMGV